MARAILKADPDVNLYAVFSENTDAILLVGTRNAIKRWLTAEADRPADASPVVIEGRLARADMHGSSSLIPLGTGDGVLYGWNDHGILIGEGPGGNGTLPREALLDYCLHLQADRDALAAALVQPDEDED